MARRALLSAALGVTRLAPSGSHLYALHIWLHSFSPKTLLVDGTQRGVVIDRTRRHSTLRAMQNSLGR